MANMSFLYYRGLEEYLEKLKEYTQKKHICGDRNSFSKSDKDATFMRMREDAMGNGQLNAGYNVQHRVVWVIALSLVVQ